MIKTTIMFNPRIKNLFAEIKTTTKLSKYCSIFLILFQYFAAFCGGQYFLIITTFLFVSTVLVLILSTKDEDIVNNFWMFFVLGPGLLAFIIVVIIELVNTFNLRKEK